MSCLLADIGGTNTRCAITRAAGPIEKIRTFSNDDFPNVVTLLSKYMRSLDADERPQSGLFAVAAPIQSDQVHMINIDWRFSATELQRELEFKNLKLLNDFEALAYALPILSDDDLRQIGAGEKLDGKPMVVLGPGTGFGAAGLVPMANGGWHTVSGEAGHITMAASDEKEVSLISHARNRFGHCSVERLISGPGLSFLHSALHETSSLDATEIGKLAIEDDPKAQDSLDTLFNLLGTVAADLALTFGAFGGVYIGGGMIPRHAERFIASGFRNRFEDKGRYRDYLRSIPTFLIVAEQPTLAGLAAHAQGHSDFFN